MIQLISREWHGDYIDDLAEKHRLRCRVLKEAPNPDVLVSSDTNIDELDALHRVCLLQRGGDGQIQDCVRAWPPSGRAMRCDTG